jgi:hypothetical protein
MIFLIKISVYLSLFWTTISSFGFFFDHFPHKKDPRLMPKTLGPLPPPSPPFLPFHTLWESIFKFIYATTKLRSSKGNGKFIFVVSLKQGKEFIYFFCNSLQTKESVYTKFLIPSSRRPINFGPSLALGIHNFCSQLAFRL